MPSPFDQLAALLRQTALAVAPDATFTYGATAQTALVAAALTGTHVIVDSFTQANISDNAALVGANVVMFFGRPRLPDAVSSKSEVADQQAVRHEMEGLARRFVRALEQYPLVETDGVSVRQVDDLLAARLSGAVLTLTVTAGGLIDACSADALPLPPYPAPPVPDPGEGGVSAEYVGAVVGAEAAIRAAADNALSAAIADEATARLAADGTLSDALAGKLDVSAYVPGAASTDDLPEGSANLYHTAARVRDTVLAGLSLVSAALVSAADSVVAGIGKLQAQITALTSTVSANSAATSANAAAAATNAADLARRAATQSHIPATVVVTTAEHIVANGQWAPGTFGAGKSFDGDVMCSRGAAGTVVFGLRVGNNPGSGVLANPLIFSVSVAGSTNVRILLKAMWLSATALRMASTYFTTGLVYSPPTDVAGSYDTAQTLYWALTIQKSSAGMGSNIDSYTFTPRL